MITQEHKAEKSIVVFLMFKLGNWKVLFLMVIKVL